MSPVVCLLGQKVTKRTIRRVSRVHSYAYEEVVAWWLTARAPLLFACRNAGANLVRIDEIVVLLVYKRLLGAKT